MSTLVWMVSIPSCIITSYLTFRVTKWYYTRKIKKLQNAKRGAANSL